MEATHGRNSWAPSVSPGDIINHHRTRPARWLFENKLKSKNRAVCHFRAGGNPSVSRFRFPPARESQSLKRE